MKRNENGLIILDDFIKLDKEEKGRKKKSWFLKDGREYLFKVEASNYEIFAEVISAELAKQCNIETASYDIAIYNGQIGVVTPSFLKSGDVILSGEDLYKCSKILSPNSNFDNSIDSIISMLKLCTRRDYDIENIRKQLIKFWLFDGLIYESDRNFTNWSIIINGNDIRISPLYDCSTMCRMNNNIHSLINSLMMGHDISTLLNSVKFQLKRKQNDKDDNFLDSFYNFCIEELDLAEEFITSIDNIDYEKAIENIEKRMGQDNNSNFRVPWECNFWISRVLKARIDSFKAIFEYSKSVNKDIEKKM